MQLDNLKAFLEQKECIYRENEPMSSHTTFKIGGPADIMAEPVNEKTLSQTIGFCNENEIPFYILGNGSNLLVSDLGIEGLVIHISGGFSNTAICEIPNEITCGAGTKLSFLCSFALDNSLSGLEFAWGIPGSAGGALYMNAGAYGSEMSDIVTGCSCILSDGRTENLSVDKLKLGYRTSIFKEKKNRIITGVKYKLTNMSPTDIRNKMEELIERRKSKQPLEFPSAGSTFKRPAGNFAGSLIEMCGMKGFSVGGATVSEKHAGFVINNGGATASDVRRVIEAVQNKVFLETSVKLEPEVEFIGR